MTFLIDVGGLSLIFSPSLERSFKPSLLSQVGTEVADGWWGWRGAAWGGGSLGGMYWSLLFTQSIGHGGPAVAAVSRVHRVPVLHQTAVLSYHAGGHVSQPSSLH